MVLIVSGQILPNGQMKNFPKKEMMLEIPVIDSKLDISPSQSCFPFVKGDFYFDDSKDNLVLTAERIWVEGDNCSSVLILMKDKVNNAKIVLIRNQKIENPIIGPVQDVSTRFLLLLSKCHFMFETLSTMCLC